MTWACPENRVWSQTFTPGGWGHQKQTTSSGRRAPEVAVWTRDIYKHGVHNSFVIYKYTAVLQVFKFHKKEEGRGKGEKKTTQRTKQKGKKKTLKKTKNQKQNKARLTTQLYRSKDDRELTYSHTFVVCTSITEVATHGEGGSHVCLRLATPNTRIHAHRHARPHAYHTHTHPHAQTRLPGSRRREAGITSPRPPLCNNQGRYHQTSRGRGTSAASLWRRRGRWSRIPSSLSSFSVFGLQDPLVTEESGQVAEVEGKRTKPH